MFAGLINHAKAAASGLVLKYVARASVAVPFVIALGFALAAITRDAGAALRARDRLLAGGGGPCRDRHRRRHRRGVKEHEEEVAEQQAEQSDTEEVISDATAQAMMQAPLALLGAVFTMPGGATTALKVARILGRNYPLVLLLVLIGALFWPTETRPRTRWPGQEQKPNGFQPAETLH